MRDAIRAIAEDQHGVILRHQALETGLSSSAIQRQVANETWVRLAPRAYGVVELLDDRSELAAATLAHPDAVSASHRAGAHLYRLDGAGDALVEVTVTTGTNLGIPGGVVHRTKDLTTDDLFVVDGITCTTPTRTLCDVGAVVDDQTLELMVESALRLQLTTLEELRARAEALRRPRRSGPPQLIAVLDRRPEGAAPTESWLETVFVQTLRGAGVDQGVPQYVVRDGDGRFIARLDRAWPEARLYSELNGRAYHGHLEADRDRWRQNRLAGLGWLPLQFSYDDVTRRPVTTARTVQRALEHRRPA